MNAARAAERALEAADRDALAAASGGEDHVYANAGPLTTSIDVIAYRGKRGAPIIQSRAHLRSGRASWPGRTAALSSNLDPARDGRAPSIGTLISLSQRAGESASGFGSDRR